MRGGGSTSNLFPDAGVIPRITFRPLCCPLAAHEAGPGTLGRGARAPGRRRAELPDVAAPRSGAAHLSANPLRIAHKPGGLCSLSTGRLDPAVVGVAWPPPAVPGAGARGSPLGPGPTGRPTSASSRRRWIPPSACPPGWPTSPPNWSASLPPPPPSLGGAAFPALPSLSPFGTGERGGLDPMPFAGECGQRFPLRHG